MTSINLRKASALQNNINERLRELDVVAMVNITPFEAVDTVLTEALAKLKESDRRRESLLIALYAIRDKVAQANISSGLSTKLTTVAFIDKRQSQLEQIVGAGERIKDNVLNGKLAAMKSRTEAMDVSRYGYGSDSVSTSVLDAVTIDEMKGFIQSLKRDKQAIKDEILELNMTTKIVLSDSDSTVLVQEGLL